MARGSSPGLLIMSTLLVQGCTRPDRPTGSPLGVPRPLVANRPSPGRTITREVDNARSRVQQECAQMKALGIRQIVCEEAEAILDVPGHLEVR